MSLAVIAVSKMLPGNSQISQSSISKVLLCALQPFNTFVAEALCCWLMLQGKKNDNGDNGYLFTECMTNTTTTTTQLGVYYLVYV